MKVSIYELISTGKNLVGTVSLIGVKVAFDPPSLEDELTGSHVDVRQPDRKPPTPAAGKRYLEALPYMFHGSYFWAEAVDEEAQKEALSSVAAEVFGGIQTDRPQ